MPEVALVEYEEIPGLFLMLTRDEETYEDHIYTDPHDEWIVYYLGDCIMNMYGEDECLAVIAN